MSSTVFVRDRREAEIELRETLPVEKSIDLDDLHQGATSRPRIFFFRSSYSLRWAVGLCRSRCAEQALRFDRVAAATT